MHQIKTLRFSYIICAVMLLVPAPFSSANTGDLYHTSVDAETTESNRNSMLCMDIRPQHSVDIEQIMGVWYGNEIIMHTQDVPGVYSYDSCVIIHLSDITDQMQMSMRDYNYNYNSYRYTTTTTMQPAYSNQNEPRGHIHSGMKYLRLVWTEGDSNLEYTFNYTAYSPGLWHNVGEQRGSFLTLNQYTQFKGSVQVVKAVNDHLVLTFCGKDLRSNIYTVVLSRTAAGLTGEELRSIRGLLSRRGLSTETIRKVCSAAAGLMSSTLLLVLLGIINILRKLY